MQHDPVEAEKQLRQRTYDDLVKLCLELLEITEKQRSVMKEHRMKTFQ